MTDAIMPIGAKLYEAAAKEEEAAESDAGEKDAKADKKAKKKSKTDDAVEGEVVEEK